MEWKNPQLGENNRFDFPSEWLKAEYFEVLNILFRVENALRIFMFIILKDEFLDKWKDISLTSDDEENYTIGAIAKKRMSQDQNYAYLGYEVNCPLAYLTSGELIRVITSEKYWKLFKKYFLGSKEIIKNKLDEIGKVRNSVAHFRPIKKGDVELIKQNSIHTLSEIEAEIVDYISCSDRVPSNTEDIWYENLVKLTSDYCNLSFFQSKNENWLQINVIFKSPSTIKNKTANWIRVRAYNFKTEGVFLQYPELIKHALSITESNPFVFTQNPEEAKYTKRISFTFSRKSVIKNHEILLNEFDTLFSQISSELNLIEQDNLARGKLLEIVSFFVEKKDSEYYTITDSPFESASTKNYPPEFWGSMTSANSNFITDTNIFPWMPQKISDGNDLPF